MALFVPEGGVAHVKKVIGKPYAGKCTYGLKGGQGNGPARAPRPWLPMEQSVLEGLGLSRAEGRLYEQLLSQPPSTAEELQELVAAQPSMGELTALLTTLEELGLVACQPGDPPRFSVAPPEAALNVLIAARTSELTQARQRALQLTARFHNAVSSRHPRELVELVHGRENVLRHWGALQRSARQEICALDRPPYVGDPSVPNSIEMEQLRRGIRYRVLYDRRALDLPGVFVNVEQGLAAGESARVSDVPMKLVLSDAPLALLPLHLDPADTETSLLVHDSALLDALRALFETCWERAVPLHVQQQSSAASADEPTEFERRVLLLLLAGWTDGAIAAQLGRHERTIGHHVQKLLVKLDCASRFQAGYQAVLRGWLPDDTTPQRPNQPRDRPHRHPYDQRGRVDEES